MFCPFLILKKQLQNFTLNVLLVWRVCGNRLLETTLSLLLRFPIRHLLSVISAFSSFCFISSVIFPWWQKWNKHRSKESEQDCGSAGTRSPYWTYSSRRQCSGLPEPQDLHTWRLHVKYSRVKDSGWSCRWFPDNCGIPRVMLLASCVLKTLQHYLWLLQGTDTGDSFHQAWIIYFSLYIWIVCHTHPCEWAVTMAAITYSDEQNDIKQN